MDVSVVIIGVVNAAMIVIFLRIICRLRDRCHELELELQRKEILIEHLNRNRRYD